MNKVQVSPDTLYKYLTEHGLTISRLAELMGTSNASLTSCFNHKLINNGVPRQFTAQNIDRLNEAISQLASELRQSMLTFDNTRKPNRLGNTYDPALVEPIKRQVGRYFNINILTAKVLGWKPHKKHNVLETVTGNVYGCITREDCDRINAELLSVAGVLSSYEVVAEDNNK